MSSLPVHTPAGVESAPPTVRAPTSTRLRVAELGTYGPLIRALASRDLKARYKQSALGPAWVVLNACRRVCLRLVVWTYFQAVTMVSVGALVNNYALVRWTACPRVALPLATLASNLPSFGIPALAALIAAGASGFLGVQALLLPVLFIWLVALVAAAAIVLSAVSVRARDVLSATPFLLQVMLFLSPVAYGTSQLPRYGR